MKSPNTNLFNPPPEEGNERMAMWTKILRCNAVIGGRLVQVESKQNCYYRYIIHVGEKANFDARGIISSDYFFTSWMAAFGAGKRMATKIGEAVNKRTTKP